MTARLVVIGAIFVILAGVFAFLIDSSTRQSTAVPSSEPVGTDAESAAPQAAPEQPASPSEPNRANCNQIRGTDYLSATEREWYRANCT